MPSLKIAWVAALFFLISTTAQAQINQDLRANQMAMFSARVADLKTAFERVVGNNCGDPCVMPHNHGTAYGLGLAGALALITKTVPAKLIVINGLCVGECVVFAGLARQFICVGPDVRFAFYRIAHHTNFRDPPLPEELTTWVRVRTGITDAENVREKTTFPLARSLEDALMMMFADAVRFWKPCDTATLVASMK
ncbi:MAG: hypothetical protein AAB449_00795 [Patescibacteria group bacterium]